MIYLSFVLEKWKNIKFWAFVWHDEVSYIHVHMALLDFIYNDHNFDQVSDLFVKN